MLIFQTSDPPHPHSLNECWLQTQPVKSVWQWWIAGIRWALVFSDRLFRAGQQECLQRWWALTTGNNNTNCSNNSQKLINPRSQASSFMFILFSSSTSLHCKNPSISAFIASAWGEWWSWDHHPHFHHCSSFCLVTTSALLLFKGCF